MSDAPTVLVTGGSRGIGAATARLAAAQGYDVVLSYRANADAADAVAAQVRAAGRRATTLQADIAEPAQVEALFDAAWRALGTPTGVVLNAGIVGPQGELADMGTHRLQRMVEVNVTGMLVSAREAARRLSTAHGGAGGSMVLVSSAASRLGSPGEYVDYAATKGAVDSLTLGLSKELGPQGVRVNAVRPGFIDTDIHGDGGEPGRVARLAPGLPLRRGGAAEEVAQAIMWLLGDTASYTTGALLDVAGGR